MQFRADQCENIHHGVDMDPARKYRVSCLSDSHKALFFYAPDYQPEVLIVDGVNH